MARNRFAGEGNIGRDPVLKYIPVKGEQKPVIEFDVRFPFQKLNQQTGQYEDVGGFWATVAYWGKRAEHANTILRAGTRVYVEGEQSQEEFVASKGERAGQVLTANHITADFVGLSLLGIESVNFTPRKNRSPGTTNHVSEPPPAGADEMEYDPSLDKTLTEYYNQQQG